MSEFYKPRKAYQLDENNENIIGRASFRIAGEMSDGTKIWHLCSDDGLFDLSNGFYTMHRYAGHMIAFYEGK